MKYIVFLKNEKIVNLLLSRHNSIFRREVLINHSKYVNAYVRINSAGVIANKGTGNYYEDYLWDHKILRLVDDPILEDMLGILQ